MTDDHSNRPLFNRPAPATLATAKHGGCVQLPTSERERFEARARVLGVPTERTDGLYHSYTTATAWLAWQQAALSAQPSSVGQTDAWATKLARESALAHSYEHAYLPQTRQEANRWQPHAWVIAAIHVAALGARRPPAQAVELDAARCEGHDCAIRYVLGYLCSCGDWGSTQYVEILNGCGRESIICSAIEAGELEFTGLGRWVAECGTDEERALIGNQAVQS